MQDLISVSMHFSASLVPCMTDRLAPDHGLCVDEVIAN